MAWADPLPQRTGDVLKDLLLAHRCVAGDDGQVAFLRRVLRDAGDEIRHLRRRRLGRNGEYARGRVDALRDLARVVAKVLPADDARSLLDVLVADVNSDRRNRMAADPEA